MLAFDPQTGFPPPGRTRLGFRDAEAVLVDDPQFAGSSTRRGLWEGLERYLARFASLEARYEAVLEGRPLLMYLWLAGSFVSTEPDPSNIDLTVFLDASARKALAGREGAGWIGKAFSPRDKVKDEFGLSPLAVYHRPLPHVFQPDRLDDGAREYLQFRGAFDDWWQRCRPTGPGAILSPTVESTVTLRGYVEVDL